MIPHRVPLSLYIHRVNCKLEGVMEELYQIAFVDKVGVFACSIIIFGRLYICTLCSLKINQPVQVHVCMIGHFVPQSAPAQPSINASAIFSLHSCVRYHTGSTLY